MPSIDFKQLKDKVRLVDVMRLLGLLNNNTHENSPRGPCPLNCHSDLECCLYAWSHNLWYCPRCRRGGGTVELFVGTSGLDHFHGAVLLCERLGIAVPWLRRSKLPQTGYSQKTRRARGQRREDVLE